MANINTKLGGTNKGFGTVLASADLNDTYDRVPVFVGEDLTGGSIASSTTETQLAQVIIPADTVIEYITIRIEGEVWADSTNNGGTLKVYLGTSATFGSNTVKRTKLVTAIASSGAGRNNFFFELRNTDQTFTGQVYVQVTGQNTVSHSNARTIVDTMSIYGV